MYTTPTSKLLAILFTELFKLPIRFILLTPPLLASLTVIVEKFDSLEFTMTDVKDACDAKDAPDAKFVAPPIVKAPSIFILPPTSNAYVAPGAIFPTPTDPPFTFRQSGFCAYSSAELIYALSHATSYPIISPALFTCGTEIVIPCVSFELFKYDEPIYFA